MTGKQPNKAESRRATRRSARNVPARRAAAPAAKRKGGKEPVQPPAAHPADAGIPDEARIEQVVAALGAADQTAVRHILAALAEHLGSPEAARLWLVTRSPEFGATPLTALAEGKAKLVLAVLESRWGPSPGYA